MILAYFLRIRQVIHKHFGRKMAFFKVDIAFFPEFWPVFCKQAVDNFVDSAYVMALVFILTHSSRYNFAAFSVTKSSSHQHECMKR